jgi:hypothetical protein
MSSCYYTTCGRRFVTCCGLKQPQQYQRLGILPLNPGESGFFQDSQRIPHFLADTPPLGLAQLGWSLFHHCLLLGNQCDLHDPDEPYKKQRPEKPPSRSPRNDFELVGCIYGPSQLMGLAGVGQPVRFILGEGLSLILVAWHTPSISEKRF